MPTGTGAINLRNMPTTGYKINPGLFNQLTSRNIFAPANFACPAFGNYNTQQLLQVGIIGSMNIIVAGNITFTADAGDVVPTGLWPWNLLNFKLSGNGQNNFINCSGLDLRLRELASNRGFVDGVSFWPVAADFAAGNGASSYPFKLVYKIPVAMDDTSLIGALYAQSEATNLTLTTTVGNLADLLQVNTSTGAAVSATVYVEEEIFEVPYDPQDGKTLIIPDLTVLHGIVGNDNAIASTVVVDTALFRINGQMERLFFYLIDKSTATLPVIVPTSQYDYTQLMYGSNQTPYTYNPQDFLDARMNRDYRIPAASVVDGLNNSLWNSPFSSVPVPSGLNVLDFVADNSVRDQVLLEGVTNLRLRTSVTPAPTGGSTVHFVQETLFA